MRIVLDSAVGAGLYPSAVHLLMAAVDTPTYHRTYHLRRPFGVYSVSLARLLPRFDEVLDALDDVYSKQAFLDPAKLHWEDRLLARHESLLFALFEHLEDCNTIVKCFFQSADVARKSEMYKRYNQLSKQYRDSVAPIVNRIKHNQRRLRPVIALTASNIVVGYFVEGVNADEVVMPDPVIHPNGIAGISFNRELRFHFANLFILSARLAEVLQSVVQNNGSVVYKDEDMENQFFNIASRLQNYSTYVLPTEIDKPFPKIEAHIADDSTRKIVVEMLPSGEAKTLSSPCQVIVGYRGDGVTTSFKLPLLA